MEMPQNVLINLNQANLTEEAIAKSLSIKNVE